MPNKDVDAVFACSNCGGSGKVAFTTHSGGEETGCYIGLCICEACDGCGYDVRKKSRDEDQRGTIVIDM